MDVQEGRDDPSHDPTAAHIDDHGVPYDRAREQERRNEQWEQHLVAANLERGPYGKVSARVRAQLGRVDTYECKPPQGMP